jgi:hypothetical protein
VHSKGPHGYGGIWGGKNASFINNILAHHNSRNPRLHGIRYVNTEGYETVELTNNLIYNWGEKAIYGGENGIYNIIGNIFIPGPATHQSARNEILEPYQPFGKYYLEGNVFFLENDQETEAGWDNVLLSDTEKQALRAEQHFNTVPKSPIKGISECYYQLLDLAGAGLVRDTVDQRVINEIRTRSFNFGENGIIDSQDQVGGWPFLNSSAPPPDSDGDGIPDVWELENGLNPNNPADGNANSLHRQYTNLEVYLNQLVKHTFP